MLILSWLSLLFLSRWSFGSWAFVYKCWPVRISDLTPNLGIYWYLLTNMFEPFRPLFEISFQLIPLFLLIPLTIRFLNTPSFVWYCMLELAVFFKPYPAAVEVLFCLAFFSLHWPLVRPKFRKIGPVIFAISLVSGFSSMVMWYLWINRGSGNANFLYFQFLALNVVRMLVLLESVTSVRLQLSDA